MFFPKYAPNGLHGIGDKLAYIVYSKIFVQNLSDLLN